MKPVTLLSYDKPDIDSRSAVVIEPRILRRFRVKIALRPIGDAAGAKASAKTPALWIVSFQADKIVVQLRIGAAQHALGEFDVGAVADAKRRNEIVQALREEGVLGAAEVTQFVRRHPDTTRIAELRRVLADKLRVFEALKNELLSLKAELAGSGG